MFGPDLSLPQRLESRRLHDPALTEDAVHDMFEAVLSGHAPFEGRAALRSWVTAILKNKLVDVIHQRARLTVLTAMAMQTTMPTAARKRSQQPATTPARKKLPATASCWRTP